MSLQSIGVVELVSVGSQPDILAKIDTGADSSSVWASNITVDKNGVLKFSLFGEDSPYYNGKVYKRKDFSATKVRSSNGQTQIRYKTHIVITIAGRRIKAFVTLADRSKNKYAVLVGRRTIAGKFLVDTKKRHDTIGAIPRNINLNEKLKENPYEFHKKYIEKEF